MKLNRINIIIDSDHSESYSELYDRFIEGWIKSENIYRQENSNNLDKKITVQIMEFIFLV